MASSACAEPRQHRRGARLRFRFALLGLDHLQHALDAEQRLGARGGGQSVMPLSLSTAASTWRSAASLSRIWGAPSLRLTFKIDGEAAARDALADRLADARLQALEARRQAQPHIEAAALTERTSQCQSVDPVAPSARANPVMLLRVMERFEGAAIAERRMRRHAPCRLGLSSSGRL